MGDMTEMFKMIHGIDEVNLEKLFCIDENGRKRKQFMFKNYKTYLNSYWIQLYFFTRRVINYWNYLTNEVGPVGCLSLVKFKIILDEIMTTKEENYIYWSSINAWFISVICFILEQSVKVLA